MPHPLTWLNPLHLPRAWRHEAGFDDRLAPYRLAADRVMLGMCAFLTLVCLALAPLRGTWAAALVLGAGTLVAMAALVRIAPGQLQTRLALGCAFMVYTGLVIHQTGGSIEGHFTAFGLIGVLLYYRDWRVIGAATLFIYLHHLVLGYLQTLGLAVYVFDTPAFWTKFVVHVAYFLPFVALMGYLAIGLRREGHENRLAIALARDIAEGDFTRTPDMHDQPAGAGGLLTSVNTMRASMLDLLRSLPVAVMIVRLDDGLVADVNPTWQRLFGLSADEAAGHRWSALPLGSTGEDWAGQVLAAHQSGQHRIEVPLVRAGGLPLSAIVTSVEHRTARLRLLVLAFEDVTLRREAERRMRRLAFQDALTGLANRAALAERLRGLLAPGHTEPWALLAIDLDEFKPVNDRHGHEAGDRVLQAVGERLRAWLRDDDLPARLGGDEFVVVLPGCARAEEAAELGHALLGALCAQVDVKPGVACRVGATIGAAWFAPGRSPTTVEAALAAADAALYDGKRAGRCQVRVHAVHDEAA